MAYPALKRCCERMLKYDLEIGVIILTIISVVNIRLLWLLASRDPGRQALAEINGLLPQFELKVVRFPFEHSHLGQEPLGVVVNRSMDSWIDIMPVGGGFVAIDNFNTRVQGKADIQLPKAINTPDFDPRIGYGISVFHQLHCLHALHRAFNDAVTTQSSLEEFGREQLEHTYHCFDYVRRALMCAADTALEGQSTGTDAPATKGEGSYHLCRDYAAVKDFAIAHRLTDMKISG